MIITRVKSIFYCAFVLVTQEIDANLASESFVKAMFLVEKHWQELGEHNPRLVERLEAIEELLAQLQPSFVETYGPKTYPQCRNDLITRATYPFYQGNMPETLRDIPRQLPGHPGKIAAPNLVSRRSKVCENNIGKPRFRRQHCLKIALYIMK